MKNKKTNNNGIKFVKILTIITLIVLISMIGLFGIYKQNKNQMVNIIKDFTYSMSLDGARNIKLELDDSTKEVVKDSEENIIENATDEEIEKNSYIKEEVAVNSEEDKTKENYEKVKKIIQKRLDYLGIQEYNISLNEDNGELLIEVPENSKTDDIVSKIETVGKFEIIDSDTKEVLLDNNNIKSSDVLYSSSTTGTSVYLEIVFDSQGKKKLKEISETYVEVEVEENTDELIENTIESAENIQGNTTSQDNENNTNTVKKQITMKIDDEEIMTTSFKDPITNGKIQLSVGTATTDTSTLESYISQAQSVAVALGNGNLPLKYSITKNEYILSGISKENLTIVARTIAIAILVGIIILIVKHKLNGLIVGISYIGLVALYILLIKYTDVVMSIESIFGIIIILTLNYIFMYMLLKNIENKNINKAISETYVELFNKIIPICIIAIAFCFVKWIPISSFGMTLFWGIVIVAIYNIIITRTLLKIKIEDK